MRKVFSVCICFVLLLCFVVPAGASYEPYEGTVSSTYVTLFANILEKHTKADYVVFRGGQYEYILVYGELILTGKKIAGEDVDIVTVNTSSSYNSTQSLTFGIEPTFELNVGNSIIYSNLGDYPLIQGGVTKYEVQAVTYMLLVCMCVVMFLYLFKRL